MHHSLSRTTMATGDQQQQQHRGRISPGAAAAAQPLQPPPPPPAVAAEDASPNGRPFDVVIFGASGTVGKFLVEELALVVDKHYASGSRSSTSLAPHQLATGANATTLSVRDPGQFAQRQASPRRRSVPRQLDGIRWAVAGRSAVKLSETLCRAEISTGIRDLSTQIPVLLADLNHRKSLREMCAKTRLVLNCAGPYSELNAESLIGACLESRTNYLDLAHETTFIELVADKYAEEARSRGVFVINGCGFQAMSAEMGLNFTKQVADGQVDEIRIILSLSDTRARLKQSADKTHHRPAAAAGSQSLLARLSTSRVVSTSQDLMSTCGTVSLGMWRSLIREKSREIPLEQRLRQAARPQPRGGASKDDQHDQAEQSRPLQKRDRLARKDTQSLVKDMVQFRNKNSLAWLQLFQGFTQNGRGYCCPMDDLTSDQAQLIRGEMCNYELRRPDLESPVGWRPIRCSSFVSMRSLIEICLTFVWILLFKFLVRWAPFRLLLGQLPSLCSLGFVNGGQHELERDSLSHIKFCQTFIAYGTPNADSGDPLERRDADQMRRQVQLLVARIVGPEPNYVASATYAVQAALALCLERDHLPAEGGVLTPGVAFAETNIIYQLRRRNIKFEVLKKA